MTSSRRAITKIQAVAIAVVIIVAAVVGVWYVTLPPPAPKPPIKIGVLADFSGPIAILGEGLKVGVEVAKEELERTRGGILGSKIELVYGDDKNSATEGVVAATKLITVDKVVAIIGGLSTVVVMPVEDTIADYRTPFLSVYVSTQTLVERVRDNYDRYKYYFHTGIGTSIYYDDLVAVAMEYVRNQTGWNKIAILTSDQTYAKTITGLFKDYNSKLSKPFEIVYESVYPTGTKDYSPELTRAEEAGAQMFMYNDHIVGDMVTILKQWRDMKMPYVIGFGDWACSDEDYYKWTDSTCHTHIQGSFYSYWVNMTYKTSAIRKAIVEKAGRMPRGSFEAYDTFMVLADAIERAGSTDPDAIVKALEKTDYVGALGVYKYDAMHNIIREPPYFHLFVSQWQCSKYGPYKDRPEVLWPPESKTAEFILPEWLKK
jgi:branched-chain amino acid transport system substrate-binding protein